MKMVRIGCNVVNYQHSKWFLVEDSFDATLINAINYYESISNLRDIKFCNLIIFEFDEVYDYD